MRGSGGGWLPVKERAICPVRFAEIWLMLIYYERKYCSIAKKYCRRKHFMVISLMFGVYDKHKLGNIIGT
jgi:hypothetical protein